MELEKIDDDQCWSCGNKAEFILVSNKGEKVFLCRYALVSIMEKFKAKEW